MELVFATNNIHKIKEVQDLLPAHISVITLSEAGIQEEIPEPYDTFQDNAAAKARFVYERTGLSCFAEDSGLCCEALNGAPGVFSARYAGLPSNDENNLQLLLKNMEGVRNRAAWYNSTIALIWEGGIHYFTGRCEGRIATGKRGNNGFGYDPVFIPKGYNQTYGELDDKVKALTSHRKESVALLCHFINQLI